jgi:MraZ protein
MAGFLGEYPVTIDSKGRLKIPTALKKQFKPEVKGRFVINRGFEKCLVLYPYDEWEKVVARVNKLNTFKKEHRDFVRIFYRGATELIIDAADRLLVPKHLLEFAGIKSDALLAARDTVIEMWNEKTYEGQMKIDSDQFAELAERVMGGQDLNI